MFQSPIEEAIRDQYEVPLFSLLLLYYSDYMLVRGS